MNESRKKYIFVKINPNGNKFRKNVGQKQKTSADQNLEKKIL